MPILDIDAVDGHASFSSRAVNIARESTTPIVLVNDISGLVAAVTSRCRDGELRRLRVFGHGTPGQQGLGNSGSSAGTSLPAPGPGISWNWMLLCNLSHCFGPDGSLELHGCSVGDGLAGKAYVARLAQILAVPVRAGRGFQLAGLRWTHFFDHAWIEAVPEGGGVAVTEHRAVTNEMLLRAWHPRRRSAPARTGAR